MPILITTIRRYWEQARSHSPSASRMASARLRRAKRLGLMTGALLIVAAGYLSFASPASAANVCGAHGVLSAVGNVLTCTYTTPGEDTFNAPLFVNTVHVVAVGQTGGTACAFEVGYTTGDGGSGARVAANLPVTQSTLFVEVPPSPYSAPGCSAENGQIVLNGGGGGGSGVGEGGGASVLQRCSVNSSCTLTGVPQTDPRLVVAGGGGGGAIVDPTTAANINGGNAGTGANSMCNPGQSGQGATPGSVQGGGGSGGGCQAPGAGGIGGTGLGGSTTNGQKGDNGKVAAGGDGGPGASQPVPVPKCGYAWPGAGGGSGFWGGGGGGGAAYCSGGAGGGGSSYAEPVATNVSMTLDDHATPTVSISWVQPVNREYQFLTGRAIGVSFTQSAPNPTPASVTDADTGPVQTGLTETVLPPCQTSLNVPVGGTETTISEIHACAEVVTTGGSQLISKSMAGATVRGLVLRIPGLPVVKALTVISASKTTCAGSTGATWIGFLSIGSDVLISHPQVIAPNTHLTVGQFSVNLNEQTPFTLPADRGLLVDAITLSVGSPSSVTAHLIVASSESDIGDCPGQLHIS